ncbi:ribonuclease Z [Desulfurococcus mucosus]|uniref:Ribonuclease Z n=1 Tax=Desulfurococcus mucosus (strain ATCC 35584 / DSM 2162 / JCM 9187 / O7/1) TaxID=765177 RepID=E8R8S0_DESM0|nr:ribonuclease Z [Desulfurococcus mucosus]ADV64896.1 RNAse Z [Desulfurococcus mucosus DSM 2162]
MNARVFFLGTGAAVPVTRGLPCIAVKADSNIYLFDVGEGCQSKMLKAGLSPLKVKAVFVTHPHGDHYLGLPGVIQTMGLTGRKEPLKLLLPRELDEYFRLILERKLLKPGFPVEFTVLANGEVYRDEKISVRAYPVNHGVEAYGFHVAVAGKTLCYTGDTMPCSSVVENCRGVDVLIHESTFTSDMGPEAHEEYHSTTRDAASAALEAGAASLVLTHISARYSDEDVLRDGLRFFYNTVVARDMMILYL